MPYASREGVRVYYEVEGEGPPLVLAHGITENLNLWRRRGDVDALRHDFQLILFDARGHGLSDKPHKASAYGPSMADDVLAVLDDLEIPQAHFFGYSLGAMTGFVLAARHAERFHSFILGGMTPYAWPEVMVKAVNVSTEGFRMLLANRDAYFLWMERLLGRSLTPEDKGEFLSRDAEALIAIHTAILEAPPLTNDDLAGIGVPCLLFCGELDPFYSGAKESVSHMPRAAFVSLPSMDHITAFLRTDIVLQIVRAFLFNISRR